MRKKKKDDDTPKGKRPRQQSVVSKSLGSGAKRHMVVCMELKHAIPKGYENKKNVIAEFTRYADYQGAVRYIVGMAINYVLAKQVDGQLPLIDKSFIDRTWSALEIWKQNPSKATNRSGSDVVYKEIDCFIRETKLDLSALSEKCPFDVRQRTTDDIRVSCVSHIAENFETRIRSHIKHIISNIPSIVAKFPTARERSQLVNQMVATIMKSGHVLPKDVEDYTPLVSFVERGKECVQQLIHAASDKGPKPLAYALKSHTHLAIPFLAWMSRYATEINMQVSSVLQCAKTLPSRSARKAYIRKQLDEKKCRSPPKSFALMPYFTLQRCFVDYCTTEVKTVFGKEVTMEQLQEELFDLSSIPQIKNKSVKLLGFRTDGFTFEAKLIALASVCPYSPNTNCLAEAGYDMPIPKKGVDILQEKRGIYRITEKRYDNFKVDINDIPSITITTVDPGVKKPVSIRHVNLENASDASLIKDNSEVWELTSDEYRNTSGYDIVRNRHQVRCYKNKRYRAALSDLRQCHKKTSIPECIANYSSIVAQHISVLIKETLHRQRAKAKRVHQKKLQSALARVGDKIAKHTSKDNNTTHVVIYGDGHFKTPKKGVSVPWKKLAHNVACKALTFATSEHRTSCACPGCESGAMEDVHKGSRMRRCNSSYLIPASQCVFSTLVVDRDELATISLARVAYDALVNQSRPVPFRNRQRPVSADIVQRSTRKSTLSKGKKLPITGKYVST